MSETENTPAMSDNPWVIESVEFAPAEEVFPFQAMTGTLAELEGTMIGKTRGRMADGRVFESMIPITREMWDDFGEERCAELVRNSAHPPEP